MGISRLSSVVWRFTSRPAIMVYSIGIIIVVANLVVMGAGYGYSAPSGTSARSYGDQSDPSAAAITVSASVPPTDTDEHVQSVAETPEVVGHLSVEPTAKYPPAWSSAS